MKKRILSILFVALTVVLLSAVVSAAEFDLSIAEGTLSNAGADSTGVYKIVGTLKGEASHVNTTAVYITVDTSVIVPVSAKSGNNSNIASNANNSMVIPSITYYDDINEEDVTAHMAYPTGMPIWSAVTGTSKYSLKYEVHAGGSQSFKSNNLVLFEMYFKYASDKDVYDINDDVFSVDWIHYGAGNGATAKLYYYNDATNADSITLTNNVIPTPPAALTVPVLAGDIIYLQDGTKVVAETAGDYEISRDNGYVTVNTVDTVNNQTAQRVYKVEDGSVAEQTVLANAVLSTSGAQLRDDAKATGIRFKSSFLTSIKSLVSEYGFLVTVESEYNMNKNNLTAGYELTYDLVGAGAVKGIAYNASNDIFYDVDGVRTIVTAVATGIPLTKENVTTNISARPYYILKDGTVIYGETTTRQIYEVAKQIKESADQTTYNAYKEYIDSILALVSTSTDVEVDLGPLF